MRDVTKGTETQRYGELEMGQLVGEKDGTGSHYGEKLSLGICDDILRAI